MKYFTFEQPRYYIDFWNLATGNQNEEENLKHSAYLYNELTWHVSQEIRKAIISKNQKKWSIR